MKKDIQLLPLEGVSIIAKPLENDEQWQIILVNYSDKLLQKVMISSTGYGIQNDESVQTSTLRHFYEQVEPGQHQLIERIDPSVLNLENEYWLSCWINEQLLDRRFIFTPGSINIDCLETPSYFHEKVIIAE